MFKSSFSAACYDFISLINYSTAFDWSISYCSVFASFLADAYVASNGAIVVIEKFDCASKSISSFYE